MTEFFLQNWWAMVTLFVAAAGLFGWILTRGGWESRAMSVLLFVALAAAARINWQRRGDPGADVPPGVINAWRKVETRLNQHRQQKEEELQKMEEREILQAMIDEISRQKGDD